ncbi:NB-ARC domain-containing protein [Micromonospora sp. NPDC047187]|uniref:NB-ARC domain-containing protein n=1 Tax=Micromonospora sp. NPDC047187 TaxID=3155262 RepID=UPI0033FC70B1
MFFTAAAALAINLAAGSMPSWLPISLQAIPWWWVVGSTLATVATSLLLRRAQRTYDARLANRLPVQLRQGQGLVDRPEEVALIVDALVRRYPATVVANGAGGFGKTTIARLVVSDRRLLRRFHGRVYWITVGRDARGPALLQLVKDLTQRIAPGRAYPFTNDLEQASAQLAALLSESPRRLLVLDDVWFDDQLAAFPVAGSSARLVTTRVASVAGEDYTIVQIDGLSILQARQLLTNNLPNLPDDLIGQLMSRTGGWPLLLHLLNRALLQSTASGVDAARAVELLLERLQRHGPAGLDFASPVARSQSIAETIEAGLDLLGADDQKRFLELAIFPEDDITPFTMAATLWRKTGNLGEFAARRLSTRLADLGLLALHGDGDLVLNDVVRSHLRGRLDAEALRHLNRRFLEAVSESFHGVAWWELLPSVPYIREHLIWHLLEAGRGGDAEALATDMRWVQKRLDLDGPLGPDVDLSMVNSVRADRLRHSLRENRRLITETDTSGGPALLTAFVERTLGERGDQPLLLGVDDGLDTLLDRARRTSNAERWKAEAAAQFGAAERYAKSGREEQARRHRFNALIALALAMRGQSNESTRELCLAALREIGAGEPRDTDVKFAVLVYLGVPQQHKGMGLVGSALRALVGGVSTAGLEEIVPLLATSEAAARLILDTIRADKQLATKARAFLGTRRGASDDWARVIERWRRDRRRLIHQLTILDRLEADPESLREAEDLLSDYRLNTAATDSLDDLAEAIAVFRTALNEWHFDEKDAALRKAERLAGAARAEVRAAPTALGAQLAYPAAERIEELAREKRRELAAGHPPKPEITAALPIVSFRDGVATVQIRIGNADDRAPMELAMVDVTADPALFHVPESRIELSSPLRGGTSETILVRLDTRDDQDTAEIDVALTHGNGTELLTERLTIPISRSFERIKPNPFAAGALGRPVDDPQMFYGRDDLITRIRQRLREVASPGAGIAIFGRKRTGKSSIRVQLRRCLAEDDGLSVVDVGNLGELTPQQSTDKLLGVLLWRILTGADQAVTDGPRLIPEGFDRQSLIASPDPVQDFSRIFLDQPRRPPWVVMMDEFQYLEQWIRMRLIPASFLQAFKAIVERQLFHLVLVGQSELEQLIKDDPNTFGVFGLERVTYLAEEDARALVQRPIRAADGETRYRGRAVDDILRLSGGSPYYVQRLCAGLVDYMNDQRASLVTEADVALVADAMLAKMTAADFDSLEPVADAAEARRLLAAVDSGEDRIVVGLYEKWLRRNFGRGTDVR